MGFMADVHSDCGWLRDRRSFHCFARRDRKELECRETIVNVETSYILVSVGMHVQVRGSRGLCLSLKVKSDTSDKKGCKRVNERK